MNFFQKLLYKSLIGALTLLCVHTSLIPANCKPLLAFDLHGVTFTTSTKKIIKKAWELHGKFTVARMLVNPFFWHKAYQAYKKTSVAEAIFYDLSASYPQLLEFKQDFMAFANAQNPNKDTLELIQKLKQAGYPLALCSNIGPEIFEDFKRIFPQETELFDIIFTARADDHYLSKSDARFYTNFLQELTQYGYAACSIIFIDDKQSNVAKAQEAGMLGVHFTSVQKLEKSLTQLGVSW